MTFTVNVLSKHCHALYFNQCYVQTMSGWRKKNCFEPESLYKNTDIPLIKDTKNFLVKNDGVEKQATEVD